MFYHFRAQTARRGTAGLDPAIRMSGMRVGLLLNFNVPRLVDGLRR
jgi:hypothetical protein